MALVKIWTGNQAIASLLSQPSRGGQSIPGYATWQGAVTVWAANINLAESGSGGVIGRWQSVIDVPITHIPGLPAVRAIVEGTRTFNAAGEWNGMNVSSVRWVLPGSDDSLVSFFFTTPKFFGLSAPLAFGGIAQFIDPIGNGIEGPLEFWDNIFAQNDTLEGGAANDVLSGGGGNDTITGGFGSDQMNGDGGDDVFVIGVGHVGPSEAIDGGQGTDSLFASALPTTRNLLQPGHVDMSGLNFTNVERLMTYGAEVVLAPSQVGAAGVQQIMGRPGYTDVLTFRMSAGGPALDLSLLSFTEWDQLQDLVGVIGSPGQDYVVGTAFADVFVGRGGVDLFFGGAGWDRYILGPGEGGLPIRFSGGDGFDSLQLDAGVEGVLDLRQANLTSVEDLDVVQGTIRVSARQVVGNFALGSPTVSTDGILWLTGNSTAQLSRPATVEIYIEAPVSGITLADMRFTNWNDFGHDDHVIRIIGSSTSQAVIGTLFEQNVILMDAARQGVYVIGGGQADTIGASQFADYVEGGEGGDLIVTYSGDDQIAAGGGGDRIVAMDGNDIIVGGQGADEIDGGAGWDYASYFANPTGLVVNMSNPAANTGEAVGDVLIAVEGLIGSAFDDGLIGNANQNALLGGEGADYLDGAGGGDYLFGQGGNDGLMSRQQADYLDGGAGFDFARYDEAPGPLRAYLYEATLNTGFAAGDTYVSIEGLLGSAFSDDLRGDAAQNIIYGLDGGDFVIGLGGSDLLIGGNGQDLFHFVGIGDGGSGGDVIQDFISGVDRISVKGAFFGLGSPTMPTPIESWRFVSGPAASLATSQFIFNATTHQLFYDQDGTGAGAQVLLATLQAGATMAARDIIVL